MTTEFVIERFFKISFLDYDLLKVKNIIRILLLIPLGYLVAIGLLYFFYPYLIFQPIKLNRNYSFHFDHPFEELFLETSSGVSLNAIYFKTNKIRKGVVLYLHGNADNLQRWASYHDDFTKRGYDILFIDYKGYGKSGGIPNETNLYEDAQTAYNWLCKNYQEDEIIIYGRSLGAAAASNLATKVFCKILILETPFDDIQGVLESNLPFQYLPFEIEYDLPNNQHLKKITSSVYIFHGTQDLVVPYRCAIRLKPFLKEKDEFITIEGGSHKNLSTFDRYQNEMDRILGK